MLYIVDVSNIPM